MQPSVRQKELEALYEKRRKGHVPQISITDDDHHVTEAIGSYYDDDEPMSKIDRDARPLSFVSSPDETYESKEQRRSKRNGSYFEMKPGSPLATPVSGDKMPSPTEPTNASPISVKRMSSLGSENGHGNGSAPPSPSQLSRQSSTDTAISSFPLNDIDYESSPAAVAQELSNLQAIRRMSMNVDTADPDLPSFGGMNGVPAVAPNRSEDENDAARLFWVPARLHPELAPKEFKTFVEERVDKIKRRSGDADNLSPEGPDRSGSSGGLRRKKSMLSRQIESQDNYEDGADRLERKRSKGMQMEGHTQVELAELESLVNDPAQLIRRLSLDSARRSQDSGIDVPQGEDMPVLPPGGQSLKRSTRTAYRRGSLKKGERVPFSKRAQQRHAGSESDEPPTPTSVAPAPFQDEIGLGLSRVQTEPTPVPSSMGQSYPPRAEAGSRWKDTRVESKSSEPLPTEALEDVQTSRGSQMQPREGADQPPPRPQHRHFQSRLASGPGRTTAQLPGYDNPNPLPQIFETLPDGTKVAKTNSLPHIPERKSSHELPRGFHRGGAHLRSVPGREPQRSSTLDDISSHPSPLPGSSNTSTDALTMVPTFDDRKVERKESVKKSGWKWILGSDDDGREKKNKEDKASDSASGSSTRSGKFSKSGADKARLDVLQSSIESNTPSRGRESLVLNRDEVRLEEERRKESKKSSESKKDREKESGLLSAIFGSKKKASDGDLKEKRRKSDRNISPDPIPRILRPDIDYNWTRFSILEERAIYRMAHIKLANPRRALYSQVLLSNFMYSYLAKVQMMHPQVQIPAAHQKSQQRSQQQQEQQPAEYSQYQRWQQQQEREPSEPNASPQNNRSSMEIMSGGGAVQPGYEYDDGSSGGYENRSSEEYEYEHSYQSQQAQQPQQAQTHHGAHHRGNGMANGGGRGGSKGYSVAQSHDYLGYPKDQQPFDSHGLWEEEEQAEDLW